MKDKHPASQLSLIEKIFYFVIGVLASQFIALIGIKIGLYWGLIATEALMVAASIFVIKKKHPKPVLKVLLWGVLIRSALVLVLTPFLINVVFSLINNVIS